MATPTPLPEALIEDLIEANANIERMAKRYTELEAEKAAIEVERDRWKKERIDIGNRLDLHLAECEGDAAARLGKLEAAVTRLQRVTGLFMMDTSLALHRGVKPYGDVTGTYADPTGKFTAPPGPCTGCPQCRP